MLHTDGPEIYLVLDEGFLCLDVCPSMTVAYHETDDSWGRGGLPIAYHITGQGLTK